MVMFFFDSFFCFYRHDFFSLLQIALRFLMIILVRVVKRLKKFVSICCCFKKRMYNVFTMAPLNQYLVVYPGFQKMVSKR